MDVEGESKIYRKEAMAVVGLSWVLATVLGGAALRFQWDISWSLGPRD